MSDRNSAVKELFENTAHYLKYDYNLRIRRETVDFFTRNLTPETVLDMPCGNGEISANLLKKANKVLFMDISSNMISLAENSVPVDLRNRAQFVNADFFLHDFDGEKFDLIICLGLLAHVESPEKLIKKLSSLVNKNGYLIIQNTDSQHFYNYLIRFYLGVKSVFKKQGYKLNHVSGEFLEWSLTDKGFIIENKFRYNQSFLGFSNLFSNEKKYSMTRNYFGDASNPKHQKMGSDITYLFKKISD